MRGSRRVLRFSRGVWEREAVEKIKNPQQKMLRVWCFGLV
jgi:hypothetical protein